MFVALLDTHLAYNLNKSYLYQVQTNYDNKIGKFEMISINYHNSENRKKTNYAYGID